MTVAISEDEISILIPTYRYRDKVGRAVESALASGAGDIAVSDHHVGDSNMNLLVAHEDSYLLAYENTPNLGFWVNDFETLKYPYRLWIKLIKVVFLHRKILLIDPTRLMRRVRAWERGARADHTLPEAARALHLESIASPYLAGLLDRPRFVDDRIPS